MVKVADVAGAVRKAVIDGLRGFIKNGDAVLVKPPALVPVDRNGVTASGMTAAILSIEVHKVKHLAKSERRGLDTTDITKIEFKAKECQNPFGASKP